MQKELVGLSASIARAMLRSKSSMRLWSWSIGIYRYRIEDVIDSSELRYCLKLQGERRKGNCAHERGIVAFQRKKKKGSFRNRIGFCVKVQVVVKNGNAQNSEKPSGWEKVSLQFPISSHH